MQNMVENQEKEVRFHRFYLVPKTPILALKGTTYLEQNLQYHDNDDQPDDATKTLQGLVSLISTVHSSIGKMTLSLNVFLFVFYFVVVSVSTECIV